MNKYKIVKKKGISQLIICGQKGQQLSDREIYSINCNEISGLLRLEVFVRGSSFKFIYDITGFISLRDYLAAPLDKALFAKLLKSIFITLKTMDSSYFRQQALLMDFNCVMVNPATQYVHFIYVPIQGYDANCSLREFLLNIIQLGTFVQGEDSSYVRDYITILNSGINFSVFELEEYIRKLDHDDLVDENIILECPICHMKFTKKTSYCEACGSKIYGNTGSCRKTTYDPARDNGQMKEEMQVAYAEEADRLPRKDSTQGLSDGTTVLGSGIGETTVLGIGQMDIVSFPYLIRCKNREKIRIDKPMFRIGKEGMSCDYSVADNNAVSRTHADILTKDGRFYVVDLGSTNRTYVDGRNITPKQEIEIFAGTRLRFANEEFDFFIEE